jgi:trimeric autotransporter adhesin
MAIIPGTSIGELLTGTTGDDDIQGLGGNDTINALAGNDTLDGGTENDSLTGSTGNDTYIVDSSGDFVVEALNEGTDLVKSSVTFNLSDTAGTNAVNVEELELTGSGVINGKGNSLDNTITGNSSNNLLEGGAGNDTLDGGAGLDTLDGGTGNDSYKVDNTGDLVTETTEIEEATPTNTEIDTVESEVSYALGSNLENLTLTGSSAINGTGNGDNNIINGNDAANVIDGGGGSDILTGKEGDDTYKVNTKDETYTVDGSDVINHGTTVEINDKIIPIDGTIVTATGTTNGSTVTIKGDTVVEVADEGTDTIQSSVNFTLGNTNGTNGANVENLTLTGNSGITGTGNDLANYITGNNAANAISGGAGNDTIDGGLGADTMTGGAGDDLYFVNTVNDTITEIAGGGTDTVKSGATFDLTTKGANVENLILTGTNAINGTGNNVANEITGNSAANILSDGGDANNNDTLIGGTGNDVYIVSNMGDVVTETSTIATEIDTVKSSASEYTLSSNVENLQLTGNSLKGTGNGLNNDIKSTNTSTTSNDTINGGGGADTMAGGDGNDTYTVDNIGDVVTEASGKGNDKVISSISYSLASNTSNVENLELSGSGSINATGNGGNNNIVGNSGSNIIDGGAGDDTMTGGNGNDTYIVNSTEDKVDENGSTSSTEVDKVQSSVTYDLSATGPNIDGSKIENLTLVDIKDAQGTITNTAAASATGNALNNNIVGNSADNAIDGKAGKDTMSGGAGDDTYTVDDIGDVVIESSATGGDDKVFAAIPLGSGGNAVTYTLPTNVEDLEFTGSVAINAVGNTLANEIIGNDGANVINGGAGADVMKGGAGNDTYTVDNKNDSVSETTTGGTDAGGIDKVKVSLPLIPATTSSPAKADTYNLPNFVEDAELTGTNAINITANDLDNNILGNAASNTIDGGAGADTMTGGSGNDTYIVDETLDVINETATGGIDTVKSSDTYTLTNANLENLVLIDLPGTPPTATNIDGTGNALANKINGSSGNNTIDGGAGADTMTGGDGQDTYKVDSALDVVIETNTSNDASQEDTVEATLPLTGTPAVAATYTLTPNVENLVLKGSNDINGTGNDRNNKITGNDNKNLIDGKVGADTMTGGLGDDTYIVDSPGDFVTEASGANTGTDTVKSSVDFTLGTGANTNGENVENLVLTDIGTTATNINGTGNTSNNIITGSSGNNNIVGNDGNDTLTGGAGNDTLDGGTGDDAMTGGIGNDTYVVDAAGDTVTETSTLITEIDTVKSSVNYTLGANLEKLELTGSDVINGTGNALANTITGNSANNIIDGKAGKDTMAGGDGNDTYFVDTADIASTTTVNEGDFIIETSTGGTDTVNSSVTFNLATNGANVENLVLTGTTAINGTGNALNNIITGNSAANIIDGGTGNDTMTGGLGNDTYVVDSSDDTVTETSTLLTEIDTVKSSVDFNLTTKGANVENLVLTGTAINGVGNTLKNKINGNDSNNIIDGKAGNDTMIGGKGDDLYVVDSILDVVTENLNQGTDKVQSSVTFDLSTKGANVENLRLNGTNAINGTGNTFNNNIEGNGADNILDGKTGNDTMIGANGDDTYIVDSAGDIVTETSSNGGTDTVKASLPLTGTSAATYTLTPNVENLILTGSNAMNGTGNSLDNEITGNTGANILDGGTGADTLMGGTGNDTYIVDNIDDLVTESSTSISEIDTVKTTLSLLTTNVNTEGGYILGANLDYLELIGTAAADATGNNLNNKMTGNSFANNIDGGTGNDTLLGNGGADTLIGGLGNDSLVGGDDVDELTGDNGNDTLVGGNGADEFIYNTEFAFSTANFGMDVISDFTTGDKIELGTTTFSALTTAAGGSLGSEFAVVATDALAATNDAFITYSSATGRLFYNQNGSAAGLGTGAQFATLTGIPEISDADFIIADV